jgi:hypothetical protein
MRKSPIYPYYKSVRLLEVSAGNDRQRDQPDPTAMVSINATIVSPTNCEAVLVRQEFFYRQM